MSKAWIAVASAEHVRIIGADWSYQLRFGLFGIDDEDADVIAQAMMQARRDSVSNAAISVPSTQPSVPAPKNAVFEGYSVDVVRIIVGRGPHSEFDTHSLGRPISWGVTVSPRY